MGGREGKAGSGSGSGSGSASRRMGVCRACIMVPILIHGSHSCYIIGVNGFGGGGKKEETNLVVVPVWYIGSRLEFGRDDGLGLSYNTVGFRPLVCEWLGRLYLVGGVCFCACGRVRCCGSFSGRRESEGYNSRI